MRIPFQFSPCRTDRLICDDGKSHGRRGQPLNLIWIRKNDGMELADVASWAMKKAAPKRRGSLTGRKYSRTWPARGRFGNEFTLASKG